MYGRGRGGVVGSGRALDPLREGVLRIGISGGTNLERLGGQLAQAESEGFGGVWFAGATGADVLTTIAVAGHASSAERIELGTSIVQTYPCHPVLMAERVKATRAAVGPDRFTLGLGVSHQMLIESYGLSYERPAKHMREYLQVLRPLLRGEPVDHAGEFYRVQARPSGSSAEDVPVLVAALAPAMLRVAGELADGTITGMANRRALETRIAPRLGRASDAAGRPKPRIVAGLLVGVCDDEAEGREAAARQFGFYGELPNYQRILSAGGISGPGEAAVIGDEDSVARQLEGFVEAGASDIWTVSVPVGADRRASLARTRALLRELASA